MSPHIETPVANCCVFAQRPRKSQPWFDKAKMSFNVGPITYASDCSWAPSSQGTWRMVCPRMVWAPTFGFGNVIPILISPYSSKVWRTHVATQPSLCRWLSLNYTRCFQGSSSFILMTSNLLYQSCSLPCQTFQSGWVRSTQQGQLWRQPKDTHRLQDSLHYLHHRWWWWWSPTTLVAMMPMLKKVNNITFPFPSFPPCPPRRHHRRRLPLSPRQVNQIVTRPAGGLKKYKYKVNQIQIQIQKSTR